MRVDLQAAYILHARPYRDTSLLVDVLTPDFGRMTCVARGVRKTKTPKRNLLNPFNRLLVSWQGKTDMKLLTSFESDNHNLFLRATHLYSGFYINELLVRLLPESDSHHGLFFDYEKTLDALAQEQDIEPLLRQFEFRLLNELGYGINLIQDARSGEAIQPLCFYEWQYQEGFFMSSTKDQTWVLKGEWLLAIAEGNYADPQVRVAAKQLMRRLLKPLLGWKPLQSRDLFVQTPH
jgi:DNA repair protein RecO (recombination protein O)